MSPRISDITLDPPLPQRKTTSTFQIQFSHHFSRASGAGLSSHFLIYLINKSKFEMTMEAGVLFAMPKLLFLKV